MPLAAAERRQHVEGALDALAEREGLGLQLDLAGLDLGEVEDVVDDRQERLGGGVDGLREVALLVVERRVEEQAAHADDGVHRGPDLVAHGGQEGALGLVGLLGGLLGRAALLEEPRVLDGDGGLLGKPDQEGEVGPGEALARLGAPDGHHADDLAARAERRRHQPVFDVVVLGAGDGRWCGCRWPRR